MIAFDTQVTNTDFAGAGPAVWSHTAPNNGILFVGIVGPNDGVDHVTAAPTFNGVSMTLVGKVLTPTDNSYLYLYVLQSPAPGSFSVSVPYSGTFLRANSITYKTVRITGGVDNSTTVTAGSGNLTATLTTVANNCWTVLIQHESTAAGTAGSGSTKRSTSTDCAFYDSNGAVTPAGSKSMTINAGGGKSAIVMASFAPPKNLFQGAMI